MEIGEMAREMIRSRIEEEPQMDEPTCLLWKADHKDCKGCHSELSCAKMVAILLIILQGSTYEPKDFEDSVRTMNTIHHITDKILDAKTVKETYSII